MNYLKKLTMTLALLLATTAGAWADSFSTEAYTADATLSAVSVTGDQTLTINEGVTVTVNNGLTISSGATLTVTGGGTLVVNGATGANGGDGNSPGAAGSTAIGGSGQLAIANATITATGGAGGNGGFDEYSSQFGGEGAPAVSGVSISIQTGSLTAIGGAGGIGGTSTVYNLKYPDGEPAKAFSSFPNISDATLSYSTDNVTYTKYESGNTTLYRYMKIEPIDGPAVTIADGNGEASFKMPQYDLTATYTVKRDMSVDMNVTVGDGSDGVRFRVKQEGGFWYPVDVTSEAQLLALFSVTDQIENTNLVIGTDYEIRFYAVDDEGQPTGEAMNLGSFQFAPGRYAVKCFAKEGSNYVGEAALSNVFTLFQGYELEIPAGEYATYYMNEPLSVDESTPEGQLYTISSVNLENATATATELSVAEANTPLLVKNNADETKRIILVPSVETADEVTVAPEFKGTLVDKTFTDEDMHDADHYVCNGRAFVWVMDAGVIAPNRAWLEIEKEGVESARTLQIVFGDATGVNDVIGAEDGNDGWYDLNGRKLRKAPAQKGVFIQNGNKVLVK